jgi:hypothetical protein
VVSISWLCIFHPSEIVLSSRWLGNTDVFNSRWLISLEAGKLLIGCGVYIYIIENKGYLQTRIAFIFLQISFRISWLHNQAARAVIAIR